MHIGWYKWFFSLPSYGDLGNTHRKWKHCIYAASAACKQPGEGKRYHCGGEEPAEKGTHSCGSKGGGVTVRMLDIHSDGILTQAIEILQTRLIERIPPPPPLQPNGLPQLPQAAAPLESRDYPDVKFGNRRPTKHFWMKLRVRRMVWHGQNQSVDIPRMCKMTTTMTLPLGILILSTLMEPQLPTTIYGTLAMRWRNNGRFSSRRICYRCGGGMWIVMLKTMWL